MKDQDDGLEGGQGRTASDIRETATVFAAQLSLGLILTVILGVASWLRN